MNAVGLLVFLRLRSEELLRAAIDPLHPEWMEMQRAFSGFALYAICAIATTIIGVGLLVAWLGRRRILPSTTRPPRVLLRAGSLAVALTAGIVLVFIEVLLFKDYGIHLYEFDVFGILLNGALRRDLGIQPAEVARVVGAAIALIAAQLALIFVALPMSRWRQGALARGAGIALAAGVPGGLALFARAEEGIQVDRSEFESALPLGRQLLLRASSRPFIQVAPRTDGSGYPVLASGDSSLRLARRPNIVFFVADGLRGDMFGAELTPSMADFAMGADVITSRMHVSSGHVSEAGVFGLLYGINGQAFHAFMQARVPSFPLEVLKRNGYHTLLLASSRLSPYPSDQLLRGFDQVLYPRNDDEAVELLARYVAERSAEQRPYFVFAFFYTPHYPFTSAKPQFRKFPSVGPKARPNYMNDVLQADDYFRQVRQIVAPASKGDSTVLLATSDHGEEIRDHGVFGHASATFWNEKIVVPMTLRLPGRRVDAAQRSPTLSSHADVWPTVFDYLGIDATAIARFSDGRSLLQSPAGAPQALVTGRFFPHADRPSVLLDGGMKYWFRVDGLGANGRLCVVVTRVTDSADRALSDAGNPADASMIAAFERMQSTFWRFVQPIGPIGSAMPTVRGDRRIC